MKCPKCNITLLLAERQGVEIDYCPECRGVWLDRGELDKIIDKAAAQEQAPQPQPAYRPQPAPPGFGGHPQRPHPGGGEHHGHKPAHKHGHKHKSILSELFDF